MSQQSSEASNAPANVEAWEAMLGRLLPTAALIGPILMVAAALMVAADVQTLSGDLDWVSEPEGLLGVLAAPFLVATWVQAGRRIAERAVRTAAVVTVLGVVAATGFVQPFAARLFLADLVDAGLDPTMLNDVLESPTPYSAIAFTTTASMFLVALIAGITIVKTRAAPIWAGLAMILFVPVFITAQAAYIALEFTYLAATSLFLVGIAGTVRRGQPRADAR
jgi:hypothetical protein